MNQKFSFDLLSNILTNKQSTNTNHRSWEKMKKILFQVLKTELTNRQREMLLLFFVKRMSMTEIANQLHVNKSTVCRTIKRAVENIKKYIKYYDFRE